LSLVLTFAPLALVVPVLALTLPILVRLLRGCRLDEVTPEWLDSFSASVYYPMEGLLSNEDFAFLSRQPGFDISLYRKLRRDRLRIFRQYFLRLIRDFNRLHAVARALISQTPEDHSELMMKMIMLKLRFSLAALSVEFSYWRCLIRFRPLVVRSLIGGLEEMSRELQSLAHGRQSLPAASH
jgi:hypothetical protein